MDQKATITFYAAECMEFINYGEYHENLTLPEAVKHYKKIVKRGMSCIPGIGFKLNDAEIPDYSDIPWPLYTGTQIALDDIEMIPAYREHPLVKQAVEDIKPFLLALHKAEKNRPGRER